MIVWCLATWFALSQGCSPTHQLEHTSEIAVLLDASVDAAPDKSSGPDEELSADAAKEPALADREEAPREEVRDGGDVVDTPLLPDVAGRESGADAPSQKAKIFYEVQMKVTPAAPPFTRLYVPILYQQKAALMFLDTGAAQSFLLLGKQAPEWTPNAGIVTIASQSFQLPGRNFDVDQAHGLPVVAYMGADFILSYETILDLANGRLIQYVNGTSAATYQHWRGWPFEIVQGHMIVKVKVDGIELRLMMDTGAPDLLWLKQQGRPGDIETETTDGTGAKIKIFVGSGALEMANEPVRTIQVLRAPSFPYFEETVRILGGNIHGLFGLSSFGTRRIWIDQESQMMRVEPLAP